jgi:uncharacterized membrane protein
MNITPHDPLSRLTRDDLERLSELRSKQPARSATFSRPSRGERVADIVTATVGSWRFILIQSCLLAVWIMLNIVAWITHWDPYPFILLNLALSFQAAYATPFILMSQNRQSTIDRDKAQQDLDCDVKAVDRQYEIIQRLECLLAQEISANHPTDNNSVIES